MKRIVLSIVSLIVFSAGYAQIIGIDKEMSKVMKKAEKGDVDAMYRISIAFYNNRIKTSDRMKMFYTWTKKAAEAGHPKAMGNLGSLYSEGVEEAGVAADKKEAFKWYRKGAEGGYAFAMLNYGICLHDGVGCAMNQAEAFRWMKKAYESDDTSYREEAQYALAFCYIKGEGVEQDFDKAFELLKPIADKGESGEALLQLAHLYHNGLGVAENKQEAFRLYMQAAEKDVVSAMYIVGNRYQTGVGTAKDISEAIEWYERAAEYNNAYAAQALGELYYKGEDVEKDYDKAFVLLKQAAESGNGCGKAMRLLAACYRYGLGTSQDAQKEKYWTEQAAKNGE